MNHSMKQLVLLSQVFIHFDSSLETPFINGQYTHGKRAFSELQNNSIECDPGLLFLFLLIIRIRKSRNDNYLFSLLSL